LDASQQPPLWLPLPSLPLPLAQRRRDIVSCQRDDLTTIVGCDGLLVLTAGREQAARHYKPDSSDVSHGIHDGRVGGASEP
jgi:hypothetical protein